jgi:hypothetical protein
MILFACLMTDLRRFPKAHNSFLPQRNAKIARKGLVKLSLCAL